MPVVLVSETDPIFIAWDKSTGIVITESQISDLHIKYTDAEAIAAIKADANWNASDWDMAYTHSQNNSRAHSDYLKNNADDSTTGKLTASKFIAPFLQSATGNLKIQANVVGDVILFSSADVGDAEDGREFKIWRNAPEGNNYIRTYINASQNALIHSNASIILQNASGKNIQFNSGQHIYLNLGDTVGNDEVRVRNSSGVEVATIDSNGNADFDGNVTSLGTIDGRDVASDGTKLDGIESAATADQTGAEIKTAYETEANAYTDTKDTKLAGIASGAEVSTKEFFISAGAAILSNNASYPTPNDTYHLALADGVTFARCFFTIRIPSDFSSMASGYPKVVFKQGTGGTGNYRIAFNGQAGGIGEQLGNVLDNIAEYTMSAPGQFNEIWEEDVSACFNGLNLVAGDYVGLQIQRDSDDSSDTFVGDLDVMGVIIKYGL